MERNRVLHLLLKFKVRVVEEVFIGFFESGLVCHMVETLRQILPFFVALCKPAHVS
jgi:hypothetical protein